MCDITIHTESHLYTIYIRDVIAYYPTDGFLVFEGYTTLKNNDLPMNAHIHTYYETTQINTFNDIQITNVWRKDLQDKPLTQEEIERIKCNCGPNEECDCNITFFPTYLVILEFKTIKREIDFPQYDLIQKDEWNYCIDNRFSSSEDILSVYKALLDLPQGCSFTNDHRIEDLPFYLMYYDELEYRVNKHKITDTRIEELKESLGAFRELKEKQRKEAHEAFRVLKEKQDAKRIDTSKNYLSFGALIGVNTVGASLRNTNETLLTIHHDDIQRETLDKKMSLNGEDDLVARILRDINN